MTVPVAPLDLSQPSRLHVVGVGGPGMSAIAIVLAEMGHTVSGSDIREQPVLDRLRAGGVDVRVGHDRAVVHGCRAVTRSSAVPAHNIELQEAEATGALVLRRAGMLASICAMARSVGVAGTHGKTTTTSMLMLMLAEAGWRPSFVIGGDVADVGTGAQWTGGEWFVVEADESDGTHLELPLHGTILTNVEADHLDHYGTFEGIVDGFDRYLAQLPGPKVLCADDPVCAELAPKHGAVTYGLSESAGYRGVDVHIGPGAQHFEVVRRGERLGEVALPLRGVYNVRNALGALVMAMELGVGFDDAAAALARFGGVARRFDVRGVDGGATLVDDYAHIPGEIAAVLRAARESGDGWQRLIAVFQPNRYNRMNVLSPEYRDAFVDADVVVLTDIYASGTTPIPGVTGKLVVDAVLDAHPETRLVWLPRREDLVEWLARELHAGDVSISMGCGDVAHLPDEVLARRAELRTSERPPGDRASMGFGGTAPGDVAAR
ncbi:MAG: UDP-N-acetylmuramate--L-alanine ligase [Ilumatobacteraceae bacterium]